MPVGFRGNVATGSVYLAKSFPHNLHPFGSYCTEKILPVSPVAFVRPEADRSLSQSSGRKIVQPKTFTTMRTRKFEIAVAGYSDYRFKTLARDEVEAVVKIKCFLRKPNAECTILHPSSNDHLRENESCRRQVPAQ